MPPTVDQQNFPPVSVPPPAPKRSVWFYIGWTIAILVIAILVSGGAGFAYQEYQLSRARSEYRSAAAQEQSNYDQIQNVINDYSAVSSSSIPTATPSTPAVPPKAPQSTAQLTNEEVRSSFQLTLPASWSLQGDGEYQPLGDSMLYEYKGPDGADSSTVFINVSRSNSLKADAHISNYLKAGYTSKVVVVPGATDAHFYTGQGAALRALVAHSADYTYLVTAYPGYDQNPALSEKILLSLKIK